jgi:hypothetical protein
MIAVAYLAVAGILFFSARQASTNPLAEPVAAE